MNEIYKQKYKEEMELENQLEQKEEYLNRIQYCMAYYKNQLNRIEMEMALNLYLYQLNEFNDFDSYEFNGIYNNYVDIQKKLNCLHKEIQTIKDKKNQMEKDMERIEALQKRLASRFYENEFKEEGMPDLYHSIQGIEDLPIYGGPTESSDNKISCLANANLTIDETSDTWMFPLPGGSISAGTWAYPDGNMHLGLDVAISMYSNLYAPVNGIILYADVCTEADNGYLGNWVGWPLGGGNTICMIGSYQNELYAFSFCHLSDEIFVYPGQQIHQGDVLGLSGNSGNSTGPHCHIEVFSLHCSLEEAVSFFINTSDFSFNNGYNTPATCSEYACRIQPESIWG